MVLNMISKREPNDCHHHSQINSTLLAHLVSLKVLISCHFPSINSKLYISHCSHDFTGHLKILCLGSLKYITSRNLN